MDCNSKLVQLVLEGELVRNWYLWFWTQPLQSSYLLVCVSEDVLRFGIVWFARGGIKTSLEDGFLEKKQNPKLVVKLGAQGFVFWQWNFMILFVVYGPCVLRCNHRISTNGSILLN